MPDYRREWLFALSGEELPDTSVQWDQAYGNLSVTGTASLVAGLDSPTAIRTSASQIAITFPAQGNVAVRMRVKIPRRGTGHLAELGAEAVTISDQVIGYSS